MLQKMFRRPECLKHANGGGHAQQVHGDKSWGPDYRVQVFFLCPPILSEAELQWGAEKRPPQGSMAFWPGWSWGGERKDGCVKGGQLFREQTVM